jgi:hypothetical protein
MKKIIIVLFYWISLISCNAQELKTNNHVIDIRIEENIKSATSLILYKFNPKNPCSQSKAVSIIKEDKISECFDYVTTFNGNEVKDILYILYDTNTYGAEDVACFDTEYSLLAINDNKVIGFINISFRCNKLISTPAIKERDSHLNGNLRNVGFSKNGKENLYQLLKL